MQVFAPLLRSLWRFVPCLAVVPLYLAGAVASMAGEFSIAEPSVTISTVPGYNHAELRRAITSTLTDTEFGGLAVSSSASWVSGALDAGTKEVVLTFNTKSLINATNVATVTVSGGGVTRSIAVTAKAAVMNVVRLQDDPVRSRMYAVHQSGTGTGSVLVFDPLTKTAVANVTVGNKPSDLDISADGKELLVICSASNAIYAIDLVKLAVKEVIPLTGFTNWGVADTWARVAYGPAGVVYYTDCAWAPKLHVLRRSDRAVLQTTYITGVSAYDYGFGDFAVSPDQTALYGWAQYGWSAGWAGSFASKFAVGADGKLTHVAHSPSGYPTEMMRDPLDTPVLVSRDSSRIFMKQLGFEAADITTATTSVSGPILAMSPGGEIVTTASGIFETETGTQIATLPSGAGTQAITSDYARLVYFDTVQRQIRTVVLPDVIGDVFLGRELAPADGAVVLAPSLLKWTSVPGVDAFDLYVGTSSSAVAGATRTSPEYVGRVLGTSSAAGRVLEPGTTYFWRVDPVIEQEATLGETYSFTVATIASSAGKIEAQTVRGHNSYVVALDLSSETPGKTWTASTESPWISFEASTGVTPATLRLRFDSRSLTAGVHTASVKISAEDGEFSLPVKLTVDPLALNVLKSRPGTTKVYGLSEQGFSFSADGTHAYLLEIDALRQRITRAVWVGKGAADLAVHEEDGQVYVTNWRSGKLRAVDLETFEVTRVYDTKPFGGIGYGEGDVYRLAAGGAGRLVVEEADQWVDIALFDTESGGMLGKASVREGGGAYGAGKRYYYHGENNSSGAELLKFDTVGDVFTPLGNVRVVGESYYGSRVVQVSDDGSRVAWNGAVFDADLNVLWMPGVIIHGLSADGRLAFGEHKIFDTFEQRVLGDMPVSTSVSAFNDASGRLIVQKGTDLLYHAVAGVPLPAFDRTPRDGSIVIPTASLAWQPVPGAVKYRVYLGTSESAVAGATADSPLYLGEFDAASLTLDAPLPAGARYFWRVDIVVDGEVLPGAVQSFTVSTLATTAGTIDVGTVAGHANFAVEIPLSGVSGELPWTASSASPWIRVITPSGTAPGTLKVELDASALSVATHQGVLSVSAGLGGELSIPVTFRVDRLNVTRIKSDPDSNLLYAISEEAVEDDGVSKPAYLLEIDALDARILRVARAGSGVTDMAIHPDDGRVYVTNWKLGRLLAFDLETLDLVRTYDSFSPPGSYDGQDVYRVAAGGRGRLAIEAEDQWIDIHLFDTEAGEVLATAFEREGGGAFQPGTPYYFHGDNNISDAALRRFNTTGDKLVEVQAIRVYGASYYGSREVVMSEDGSTVFWNGAAFSTEPFAVRREGEAVIYACSADGRVMFGAGAAYDLENPYVFMPLPWDAGRVLAYNSVTDTAVYFVSGGLVVRPVGYLQPLPAPQADATTRDASSVKVAWTSPGLGSGHKVEYRVAGESSWTALSIPIEATDTEAVVAGLQAKKTYEFRVKCVNPFRESEWSELVSATTLPAPPVLTLPDSLEVAAGATLSYKLPAMEGVTYTVSQRPSGISFDANTRVLSGTPRKPGRYEVVVEATNQGGATSTTLTLVFESPDVLKTKMSYMGLIGTGDVLLGSWTLVREGDKFSVTLKSDVGEAVFTGTFSAAGSTRAATASGVLKGSLAVATVEWDRVSDRMVLNLRWRKKSVPTLDDTGYALVWDATLRPYPGRGTYTALMRVADSNMAQYPRGMGFFTLTAERGGRVTVRGETALGHVFTLDGVVTANHLVLVNGKQGDSFYWGALELLKGDDGFRYVGGLMLWDYAPKSSTVPYPGGFAAQVDIMGSRYSAVSDARTLAARGTSFRMELAGGGLDRTGRVLSQTLTLGRSGFVMPAAGTAENPHSFSLQFDPATGLVTGSAQYTERRPGSNLRTTRRVSFRGIGLQPGGDGESFYVGGYFLLPNWSGSADMSGWMECYVPSLSSGGVISTGIHATGAVPPAVVSPDVTISPGFLVVAPSS